MTPAETIRAAATRLREAAERATPGPWHPESVALEIEGFLQWVRREENDYYVALVNPVVGKAVANWLDSQAKLHDSLVADGVMKDHDSASGDPQAFAVARALLAPSGEEGGSSD